MINYKYTCIARTYIIDEPEAGYIIEDYYNVFDTNEMGADSSIIYGNDVIEMDYFDNENDKETLYTSLHQRDHHQRTPDEWCIGRRWKHHHP